jgi:formylmethanofuran dehydrogenase subunit C
MSGAVHHHLVLRVQPALRVDARVLQPKLLCHLPAAEVLKVLLPQGSDTVAVGELFTCKAGTAADIDTLTIEGDLGRFDHLGLGHHHGTVQLRGPVGHGVGLGQEGGRIEVHGNAKDLAGCSLRGGWLEVHGSVGDLAASALPGDMDGMRGGTFVIHGGAGARLADRMRRGTLVVHGDVGDLAASRMVAGTLALGGRCGAHLAWGMRRGSIVLAGAAPGTFASLGPTFVPVASNTDVFWQLLARDLARFGGAFASLATRRITRLAGDLAVQGKGELLLPA